MNGEKVKLQNPYNDSNASGNAKIQKSTGFKWQRRETGCGVLLYRGNRLVRKLNLNSVLGKRLANREADVVDAHHGIVLVDPKFCLTTIQKNVSASNELTNWYLGSSGPVAGAHDTKSVAMIDFR